MFGYDENVSVVLILGLILNIYFYQLYRPGDIRYFNECIRLIAKNIRKFFKFF
jgi:hypothetical protein